MADLSYDTNTKPENYNYNDYSTGETANSTISEKLNTNYSNFPYVIDNNLDEQFNENNINIEENNINATPINNKLKPPLHLKTPQKCFNMTEYNENEDTFNNNINTVTKSNTDNTISKNKNLNNKSDKNNKVIINIYKSK